MAGLSEEETTLQHICTLVVYNTMSLIFFTVIVDFHVTWLSI